MVEDSILIVDDVPANLDVLVQSLEAEGYAIGVAPSGEEALRVARVTRPTLILLDVAMPGIDGYETCRRLKAAPETRDIPVVFLTARGETEELVQGFRAGGVDYIVKPFHKEEVLVRVRTHVERVRLERKLLERNAQLEERTRQLTESNQQLQEALDRGQVLSGERDRLSDQLSMLAQREDERWNVAGFVGRSTTLEKILREIDLLQSASTSVLITGESGTGKELVARAIHSGSPRREKPFVPVNCAAIPADLAESLLFGHVRGSFTGADRDQAGYFDLASGGTLFLDEIGAMPLELQGKLLRVLEGGVILPLGARQGRAVDVRVLAATNADLRANMAAGAFREDLYYRLTRFVVEVPPLRERREDISLLAEHFLQLFALEMGRPAPGMSPQALSALGGYDFPGNVRELKNTIERALLESGGSAIEPHHLHLLGRGPAGPAAPRDDTSGPVDWPDFAAMELQQVKQAMLETRGNISAAARLLGVDRTRIYRLLRKHNLMPRD